VANGSFSAELVKGATLYVPAGTGMAYSESDRKMYFVNIVEMEERQTINFIVFTDII
jgi:hypothetical protein